MSIASLNHSDVLRITSGQVIVDLRAIIKELVENSIDAGSTNIDITFHNYGLDSITITDNGHGISEEYFDNICLRGYTSKISEFADLERLLSLGFRGEALNSICLVSSTVNISTSTAKDYPLISEIEFGSDGRLLAFKKRKGGMTEHGTMVFVAGIFSSLPVRHKTLVQNLKKEYHKAVNLLISYIIGYPEIRFIVSNVTNKRNIVMNSRGGKSASILDNMNNVFGSNGSRGLGPITLRTADGASLDGFISSSSYGYGRSSQNRQFLFINKRPVILKKLQKTINDVFKQFNHLQYPVFALNIVIDPTHLDVNIVPDKTSVQIHHEPEFLDEIKSLLIDFYTEQENTVPKNFFKESIIVEDFLGPDAPSLSIPPRCLSTGADRDHTTMGGLSNLTQVNASETRRSKSVDSHDGEVELEGLDNVEQESLESGDEPEPSEKTLQATTTLICLKDIDESSTISSSFILGSMSPTAGQGNELITETEDGRTEESINVSSEEAGKQSPPNDPDFPPQLESSKKPLCCHGSSNTHDDLDLRAIRSLGGSRSSEPLTKDDKMLAPSTITHSSILSPEGSYGKNFFPAADDLDESISVTVGSHSQDIGFSKRMGTSELVHDQSQRLRTDAWKSQFYRQASALPRISHEANTDVQNSFGNVDDLRAVEKQENLLTCTIKKQDFLKLRLIGQFNLGFILVSFNESDMFIIDQHASDEKINFELLSRKFQVDFQRLVLPKHIELSSIDEILVMNNASVFHRNGFLFDIDEEKPCGSRIRLQSLPVLKTTTFSIHDFHELVDKVDNFSSSSRDEIRCSKIQSILASRACRSSIMIGLHLQRSTMSRILNELSTLDKPWNCPHGRPTMRHLMSISQRDYADFDRKV